MVDSNSTFGAARAMTRSEQVRSQRMNMFDRARGNQEKKASLSATLKNSQDNAKTARTMGGLFGMFKSRNSLEDIRLRKQQKLDAQRFDKQIKSLGAVEKAIKKLSASATGGLGSNFSEFLPDGRKRYRNPKTGRFISGRAAAGMGAASMLGKAGLVGAGLAAAGAGAYISTKAIRGNQGKKFFEGGLNSRAAGYAGNVASGAGAGAIIGGTVVPIIGAPIGALIGAGVGLVGSIYADFKEEIDAYIMKKWGNVKEWAGKTISSLKNMGKSITGFFDGIGDGARGIINSLPFAQDIQNWFATNVNFSSAWGSITGFFTNVSGSIDQMLVTAFPAYGVIKEWGEKTVAPWVEKTWTDMKRGISQFISDAWSWASERMPMSTRDGQGMTRKLLNGNRTSAERQKIITDADMSSLYGSRSYAQMKADEYLAAAEKAKSKGKTKDYNKYLKKAEEYGAVVSSVENELSGRFNMGISPRPAVTSTGPSLIGGTYLPKAMQLAGGKTAGTAELSRAKENYSSASAIAGARLEAARITGADFGYLMALAKKESSFNPNAIPKDKKGNILSSARGNDQFLVGTWNDLVDQEGYKYGIQKEKVIGRDANGKKIWSDTQRTNPKNSAIMAGLLSNQDGAKIQKLLGRPPFPNELYIFHFWGPKAGAKFLKNWAAKPNSKAAPDFPDQAKSNPHIFYHKDGTQRTYQEVYEKLSYGFTTGDTQAFTELYGGPAVNSVGGALPPMPSTVSSSIDTDRSRYAMDYKSKALASLAEGQKAGNVSATEAANIQSAIEKATGRIAAGQVTADQIQTLGIGGHHQKDRWVRIVRAR